MSQSNEACDRPFSVFDVTDCSVGCDSNPFFVPEIKPVKASTNIGLGKFEDECCEEESSSKIEEKNFDSEVFSIDLFEGSETNYEDFMHKFTLISDKHKLSLSAQNDLLKFFFKYFTNSQ